MEGRSSRTREAACRSSTETATAIAAGAGPRTSRAAARVTSGRSLLPGERTASSIPAESEGERSTRGGRLRASASSKPGRVCSAKRSKLARSAAKFFGLRGEARHRLRLRLVDVEDRDELRHRQYVVDLRRKVEKLELAALVRHGGVTPDELADAGRVDGRHVLHVDQNVLLALVHQLVDRLPQLDVARSDRDLAL